MFISFVVREGQRVAVWDKNGRRTIVEGPKRIWRRGLRLEPLQSFAASPTEYLIIRYKDGRVIHKRGPAIEWLDSVEHAEIKVASAIPVDANEALVVYRRGEDQVDRRVIRGPALFMPDATEWLHQFRWHGADPANPKRKIPRGLVFNRLRVIPDQMYCNVEMVRTADDALLVIKLMIFYELMDIGVMLDQTHDPIADFLNAVSADVIDFVGSNTFEAFKIKTDQLNARETYPQLSQRAGRIGYRINKVVYCGYEATNKLQTMHDSAIEARTRLKLEAETEMQAQELADLKLTREQDRRNQAMAMERAGIEHQNAMNRIAAEEALRQETSRRDADLRHRQRESDLSLAAERTRNELRLARSESSYAQRIEFLRNVQSLDVDMTRYLVAKHERPDKRISIDSDRRAQLHLHQA